MRVDGLSSWPDLGGVGNLAPKGMQDYLGPCVELETSLGRGCWTKAHHFVVRHETV